MKKILNSEIGFKKRWNDLIKGHIDFPLWNYRWKEEDLGIRFNKMLKERWFVYFVNPEDFGKKEVLGRWKKEYEMPDNWRSWNSRLTFPIAPVYNLASSNYNASIITLHGIHFLALEAPCDKNLSEFFNILDEFKITDLVRLTPKIYKNQERSFPYWEGITSIHPFNSSQYLEVASRKINYFPIDCWEDHQGLDPKKILALVQALKNSTNSDNKIIAVHCRSGVGRTGTLIAAYVLFNDIDQHIRKGIKIEDLKISIDKVIWELSIQRPFAISHFSQYLNLYQLINYYVDLLN